MVMQYTQAGAYTTQAARRPTILKRLPVDRTCSIFLVLFLGHPHFLERVEGGEDRASAGAQQWKENGS